MNGLPMLTLLTAIPLIGGLVIVGLRSDQRSLARWLGLGFAFAALALSLLLWHKFNPAVGGLQFEERHAWIPSLNVEYRLGVDGLGLLMLVLSAIVVPMGMAASWKIEERVPLHFALVLFLQTGLFGAFTALNFFHWFIFWELSLIPAFFLIKLWGGPEASAAATQFLVYTIAGSVTLLLSFLAIFLCTGKLDFIQLAEMGRSGTLTAALSNGLGWRELNSRPLALIIFGGAFLGFAVKVPLMPFHAWLPPAYAEAPTGTTMLLTGAMSKMGVYGFLRILWPIFPEEVQWVLTPLLWLTVISIVFSASAACVQRDLKRVLAFSSINHLGYCLLGLLAAAKFSGIAAPTAAAKASALSGVLLQMFNHGLTAATLFWFVGLLEQRAEGARGINDFGGLRKILPVFCGLMGVALFSSLGLPGLNGFIGEFLIFRGAFALVTWATALSVLGLLLTAIFILTILQRVFSGPLNQRWATMPDLTWTERLLLAPCLVLMLVLGVYPQVVLGVINSTVMQMVKEGTF